jgi:uncharacterized protein
VRVRALTPLTLDELRRYAVARSLFTPTTLPRAIQQLGFVQADPIRSPARAQDLILRHRVKGYRVGDLESRYAKLPIEEDFFINYGFLPRELADLMHPRTPRRTWSATDQQRAADVLAFVREAGIVHPSEVDAHFQHGSRSNWFGGQSRASTQLLDAMHYRGLLRTARRESGIRCYAVRAIGAHDLHPHEALDRLVDVFVDLYAPLPAKSLAYLCRLLDGGVPQWRAQRLQTLARAKARLGQAQVEAETWYWPAHENPRKSQQPDGLARLLTPFDPIVWDRTRFERLWGWTYRFEAYTPAPKRQLGYYAMPLLLGDHVVGWGNVDARGERVQVQLGLKHKLSHKALDIALEPDLQALSHFLGKPLGAIARVGS